MMYRFNHSDRRRKRRFIMTIVLIVVAVLLLLTAAFGFWFASTSMGIRRQTLEQARAWQAAHYDISWYDALQKTDYVVAGEGGYALHVQLVKNRIPSTRYVLISHGYTDNRYGSLKYAKVYLDLGFNVILYDLRGHGENAATYCTYSARERLDLRALISDSRARYADMTLFGLHGESLGAATSVAVLEFRPRVDFVVADCGFSNIRDVLAAGAKRSHLPGWLIDISSLCAKVRYGFGYGDMRPIDSLKDNAIPILFIHGAADGFILPAHSQAMSAATRGYSEVHLIENAGHAESVLTDPKAYKRIVELFIARIDPSIL